jgi:hypothetical protein
MSNLVWEVRGGDFHLTQKQKNVCKELEPGIYELEPNLFGFHLSPLSEKFDFPYKIYGLENDIINRTLKYYYNTEKGNIGILLNGVKGTGKTVTSKLLCNKLELPVIIVPKHYENAHDFINSIPQDIVVFIDEYEKIYKESNEMLTIMDGALNAPYRRIFVLTTNNLYIDQNLLDRPSRIRYLKTFSGLLPEVVEEIVDDVLIHKEYKADCITFISTLDIITVDIVKSIINEVNIQDESPFEFKNVFNARTKKGKYRVFIDTGEKLDLKFTGVKVSPRIDFNENTLSSYFYVNDKYIGRVTDVVDYNTLIVDVEGNEVDENEVDDNQNEWKISDGGLEQKPKRGRGKKVQKKTKIVTPYNLPVGKVTFVVYEDYYYNDSYRYQPRTTNYEI